MLRLLLPALAAAHAQSPADPATERSRSTWFVSSSAFLLGNLLPDPPKYVQLNAGYRFTDKDALILEAITWTYDAPLGIPFGPDWGEPQHDFPGHARDIGVGLAYQRFWWKGVYTTAHVTPFRQSYFDEAGERIQAGFQLWCVLRAGWHFSLLQDRLFIEPSVAVTSWPINTNLPTDFAAQEDKWPGYFVGEPGLHIGLNL